MTSLSTRKLLAMLLIAAVTGCGGSSGSDSSGTSPPPDDNPPVGDNPPPDNEPPPGNEPPPDESGTMTMSCVDGTEFQCSGGTILRTDNGISLTRSGVQAYGISTSDLSPDNPDQTAAYGHRSATGGAAEVRIAKANDGTVSSLYLLLSNLGLSWDGKTERPPIVETFNPTQGRVVLGANGQVTFVPLPDSSDLSFYDFATLGPDGTQAHYANNRYFPRENNPSRCPPDDPCPETETEGVGSDPGNWRTGGVLPDWASAGRLHGDGDVHAGDGPPDADGNRTWLEGGNGIGVPFPGSKGYREMANWGLQYANIATWSTQDTVLIQEWARLGNEHNKKRRGVVAYGDVTAPSAVPSGGTAAYSGIVYGWHTPDESTEPIMYVGNAQASANFSTGQVTITVTNTVTYTDPPVPISTEMNGTMTIGSAAETARNYMTGTAVSGGMNGGVSARFFGPVNSGTGGPAEIAGAYSLTNPATGEAVLGGFIGRRQ